MSSLWPITCKACGASTLKPVNQVNRAERQGAPLYCNRTCAGIARRTGKSRAEKLANKAAYDADYRARNRDRLKASKAAYYAANVDRDKERVARKRRMPQHVEYCRRPEYRQWKAEYDQSYRARKQFGAFGEAAILLNQLEAEIAGRATRTEIYRANGILNKHQERRREYERQTQRR